jgi:hypothetical protein
VTSVNFCIECDSPTEYGTEICIHCETEINPNPAIAANKEQTTDEIPRSVPKQIPQSR